MEKFFYCVCYHFSETLINIFLKNKILIAFFIADVKEVVKAYAESPDRIWLRWFTDVMSTDY